MKSKERFRKIAFVRGHKNDQNIKLTLTFSTQRQTPALHVVDVPATAGKLAKSCAVMHGSWLNFRSKSPSPRKRPLLKFPIVMRRRRQNRFKNFKRHHWLIFSVLLYYKSYFRYTYHLYSYPPLCVARTRMSLRKKNYQIWYGSFPVRYLSDIRRR